MANQSSLNELALFAGAGGGILGGHLLGWRTVCAVEWEQYPASVLCARQNDKILPPFPIWDDVQTFDGRPWRGIVDVVSGGFPCQDISVAGGGQDLTANDQECGEKCHGLLARFDQDTHSWRTVQCSLIGDLNESLQTLPAWGMTVGGECFELQPLEHRITEPGFTWLLTPTAQSWKAWTFRNPLALIRRNHADGNLQEQLMRLYQRMITPQCQEILMMWPEEWTDLKPLETGKFQQWQKEHGSYLNE